MAYPDIRSRASRGANGKPDGEGMGKRLLKAGKDAIKGLSLKRGVPKPRMRNPDEPKLDWDAGDLIKQLEDDPKEVDRLLREIWRQVEESAAQTSYRRLQWEQMRRFHEGEDYLRNIDGDLTDPRGLGDEELADWVTVNHLGHLVQKVVALVTQGAPEIKVLPRLPIDKYVKAADDGNAVLGHEYRQCDIETLRQEQCRMAAVTTTAFRYWRWDNKKPGFIGQTDEFGQMIGIEQVDIGGIDVELVPGERMHFDLAARNVDDSTWAGIEHIKPISWVHRNYGRRGAYTESDGSTLGWDRQEGYWDRRDGVRGLPSEGGKAVRVIEYLCLPQPDYPDTEDSPYGPLMREGFYACVTKGDLLHLQPWPWADKKRLPLAGVEYRPKYGSIYALSLVDELMGIQQSISECWTRIIRRVGRSKTAVAVAEGQGQQAGLMAKFRQARDFIMLSYPIGGTAPQAIKIDPVVQADFETIAALYQQALEIAGTPDALMGKDIPGVDTGVQYQTMIEMAGTVHRPFVASIEKCEKRFAEGVLSEYADKADPGLLMSLDPDGNDSEEGIAAEESGNPQMQGTLRQEGLMALTDGGFAGLEVYLSPSSGIARSPEQAEIELFSRWQAGAMGPLELPTSRKALWSQSSRPEAKKMLKYIAQEEEMMAQQQEAVTQAEQGAVEGEMAIKQQESEMKMAEGQQKLEIEMQKAQAQIAALERKAEIDAAVAMQKMQFQRESEAQKLEAQEAMAAMDMDATAMQHEQTLAMSEDKRAMALQDAEVQQSINAQNAEMQQDFTGKANEQKLKQTQAEGKQKLTMAQQQAAIQRKNEAYKARQQAKAKKVTPKTTPKR